MSLLILTACGNRNQSGTDGTLPETGGIETGTEMSDNVPPSEAAPEQGVPGNIDADNIPGGSLDGGGTPDGSDLQEPGGNGSKPDHVLLQSASIDLDNDGINEQIEVVRIDMMQNETGAATLVEGRLLISGGGAERQVVFCTKENDPSELLNRIEFEDLDGDGATDIFIVIPGYGASFNYSNYFIYSYIKDISHSFSSDNTLADFINSFEFSYTKGGSLLTVTNQTYGFSADILIEEAEEQEAPEEIMRQYAYGTWIDPVSVDISEDSRLALVKNRGAAEIKLPLPVFGMATVNMIAEVDLFYRIDSDFEPVLKRCEIIDFAGSDKIKAGSFEVETGGT